jgi:hypothetical protein
MAELRSTVATWEAGGFVQRLSAPPLCVNPMTVAVQYNATTDSTKYRPCIDLSRHVNLAIEKSTVKLDDLSLVQELIEPEDYMTSWTWKTNIFRCGSDQTCTSTWDSWSLRKTALLSFSNLPSWPTAVNQLSLLLLVSCAP